MLWHQAHYRVDRWDKDPSFSVSFGGLGSRLGARRAKPERIESLIPRGTGQARCRDMRPRRIDARAATTASMAAVVRADFSIDTALAACTSVGSAPTSNIRLIPRFSR